MELLHRIKHGLLAVADIGATALSTIGFPVPWEYSERHQRKMKEKINGKK